MSLIKAGTEVPYRVTFLRMTARPDTQTALPQDITLERAMDPPFGIFLRSMTRWDAITNG